MVERWWKREEERTGGAVWLPGNAWATPHYLLSPLRSRFTDVDLRAGPEVQYNPPTCGVM